MLSMKHLPIRHEVLIITTEFEVEKSYLAKHNEKLGLLILNFYNTLLRKIDGEEIFASLSIL